MVLSDGRKSFPIGLAVLIQYRTIGVQEVQGRAVLGLPMFINATIRQQISIYSIGPYWHLLACRAYSHIWKSGRYNFFLQKSCFVPHLKIRGAAHVSTGSIWWKWRRSVVNKGVWVRSTIKLFQAPRKISFTFHFLTRVFYPSWCETCRVIRQQFSMKECDILGV